jgi:predicted metal-dependent peptidase
MKRKDLRIGIAACALAILGLCSSLLTGNEELFLPEIFGRIPIRMQKTLLLWAVLMVALTGAKYWQAKRNDEL